MSDGMLLGIDEGTTGVKAALFDQRLRPVAEARRDKVNRHPEEGLGRAGRRGGDRRGHRGRGGAACAGPTARSSPAVSTIRASRCSPGTRRPGKPLSPIVVWQDKRSQEILDELTDREDEVRSSAACRSTPTSRLPSWHGCCGTTMRSRRRGTRIGCGWARSTPFSATGSAAASPRTPRPPRAPSCMRWGSRGSASASARSSACRSTCCRRSATPPASSARSKHESWPVELPLRGQVVDQQAALAGAACVEPGRVKATYGTGVFVLAHVGEGVPEPGRRAAADRGLEHRRAGRVRARRWRLRGRGDARMDVRPARRRRESARAQRAGSRGRELGGARVLPGTGRHRRAVVAPERARGDLRDLRRHDPRERRSRRSGGNRLARGRRYGRDQERPRPWRPCASTAG